MTSTDIALASSVVTSCPGGAEELLDLTAGWIRNQRSLNTRDAYRRDVAGVQPDGVSPAAVRVPAWLPWCVMHALDPLEIRLRHVSAYARELQAARLSPTTQERKLAAISSWYIYLIREGVTERNPAQHVTRPAYDKEVSPAVGLSQDEMDALLDQAEADSPLALALISLLYFGAFRVGTVLNATVGDLGWDQGERTLRMVMKGGNVRRSLVEPEAVAAVDAYLATRSDPAPGEWLLLSPERQKMTRQQAWRMIRRLAKHAGIPSWAQLNPHSLRHTHITHALDEGVPLDEVRETAGHKSEDMTRRYDRARQRRAARSGRVLSERRARIRAERSGQPVAPVGSPQVER